MDENKINDLSDVGDHELAVRISVLLAVVDDGIKNQDVRVYRPLDQIQTLLDELKARHPKPQNQVVGLSTLTLKGEQPPLG